MQVSDFNFILNTLKYTKRANVKYGQIFYSNIIDVSHKYNVLCVEYMCIE